jgi:hypothetical protein
MDIVFEREAKEAIDRGAQVPSREMCRWEIGIRNIVTRTIGPRVQFEIADVVDDVERMKDRLNSIKSYAVESAKTAITRESILAAPQVEAPPTEEAIYAAVQQINANGMRASALYIMKLEAQLEARKLHELAQFDEMQGLRRLILSESGGGK